MWWTLMLIYLVRWVSAKVEYNETAAIIPRCSDTPGTNMTFTPVKGFVGRYTAELCTERNLTSNEWQLDVSFNKKPGSCKHNVFEEKTHSVNTEWISSNHNCTSNQTVCMSVQFDLIFSACYSIKSTFVNKYSSTFYFNVANNITEEKIHNYSATVDVSQHRDYMSITWHPGIPLSVYEITLLNTTSLSNQPVENCTSKGAFLQSSSNERVENCTSKDPFLVRCELSPPPGCYIIKLHHIAPWTQGLFYEKEYATFQFYRNVTVDTLVEPVSAWRHWAVVVAGACAVLLGGAGAVLAVRRSRAVKAFQKSVLRAWLNLRNTGQEAPVELSEPVKHVLLLYARENAAGNKAVAALRDALQHVVNGQVYDIFSAATMAECASCPVEWMRSMLQSEHVRVVLLQSPALHYLYTTQTVPSDTGLKLVSPLLGRRVVPRTPAFGDTLLQYALRHIAEDVRTRDNYHKYYVATIAQLPTDVLPCVVRYRRYALPDTTPLLLRDVSHVHVHEHEHPLPHDLLLKFTQALQEFVDYAVENPDYLMDELMLVDS